MKLSNCRIAPQIDMTNTAEKPNQQSTCFGQTLGKADFVRRPMSLRKFLEPFDHKCLTDYEAGAKYAAYKTSFAKQQLEDFFERNKNQAWFREKYHPDLKQDPAVRLKLSQHRLEVFMEMYRSGLFSNLKLDTSNDNRVAKLLDIFAIKLAGGTEEDVRFFEEFKHPEVTSKSVSSKTPIFSTALSQTERKDSTHNISSGAPEETAKTKQPSRGKPHRKTTSRDHPHRRKSAASSSSHSSSNDSSHSESDSSSETGSDSGGSSRNSASRSSSGSESGSNSSSSSGSSESEERSGSSDSESEPETKENNGGGHRKGGKLRSMKRSDRERSSASSASSSSEHSNTSTKRKPKDPKQSSEKAKKYTNPAQSIGDVEAVEFAEDRTGHRSEHVDGENKPATNGDEECVPVRRLPLHFNRVLYFPHVPLSIYQKDMIALLSTSPHFLRLAIMDPIILPSSDNRTGRSNEPFFQTDISPTVGISLRRVGWATFSAQAQEGEDLVNVDVEAICARLLHQATEAQAPEAMLECLRLARVLPDNSKQPVADRVRWKSHFLQRLLEYCPDRLYSKSLLRRHLVLAARLADELDKSCGLWVDPELTLDGSNLNAKPDATMVKDNSTCGVPSESQTIFNEISGNTRDKKMESDVLLTDKPATQTSSIPIDPGDDLVEAATILGGVVSNNPLLRGLTDYLVDEGSAEEELLLSGGFQAISFATSGSMPAVPAIVSSSDDTEMLHVLDSVILYMRMVHSVDFYAPALYVNEDAMPHPCKLIHVRPSKADVSKALAKASPPQPNAKAQDYDAVFSSQLKRLVRLIRPLDPKECVRLGLRDVDEVVDNFVKANTRRKRRKTDVIWVCLLSDKKFRDPIYVKKHIMNKHMDKVEAVKKDNALFFNNYVLDPKRPQFPLEPHMPKKKRLSVSPKAEKTADSYREESRERSSSGQTDSQWNQNRRVYEDVRPFSRPFVQRRDYPFAANFQRPYGRMPFFHPRMPFQNYRPRMTGAGGQGYNMRRVYQRRPYIDLDAV